MARPILRRAPVSADAHLDAVGADERRLQAAGAAGFAAVVSLTALFRDVPERVHDVVFFVLHNVLGSLMAILTDPATASGKFELSSPFAIALILVISTALCCYVVTRTNVVMGEAMKAAAGGGFYRAFCKLLWRDYEEPRRTNQGSRSIMLMLTTVMASAIAKIIFPSMSNHICNALVVSNYLATIMTYFYDAAAAWSAAKAHAHRAHPVPPAHRIEGAGKCFTVIFFVFACFNDICAMLQNMLAAGDAASFLLVAAATIVYIVLDRLMFNGCVELFDGSARRRELARGTCRLCRAAGKVRDATHSPV